MFQKHSATCSSCSFPTSTEFNFKHSRKRWLAILRTSQAAWQRCDLLTAAQGLPSCAPTGVLQQALTGKELGKKQGSLILERGKELVETEAEPQGFKNLKGGNWLVRV